MRTYILAFLFVIGVGVAAAADAAIPQPLLGAKAGEWVMLMEVAGENVGQKAKISIIDVTGEGDDAVIVMKRERFDLAGGLVDENEIEVPVARYKERMASLAEKADVARENLTVKDENIEVATVTWRDEENDRDIKLWISDKVPVGGVVKSWSSDPTFPASELVDYGF